MGIRERPKQLYSTSWSATQVFPLPVAPLRMTPRRFEPAISIGCPPDDDDDVGGSKCDAMSRKIQDRPQKNCDSIFSCCGTWKKSGLRASSGGRNWANRTVKQKKGQMTNDF
jgi:hypothetical protein